MDITTLAAANAYTDKKVAEGGGSGGGGLPVVDLTSIDFSAGEPITDENIIATLEAGSDTILLKILYYNTVVTILATLLSRGESSFRSYQGTPTFLGSESLSIYVVANMGDGWIPLQQLYQLERA